MKADRAPKTVVRRILNAIIILFAISVIAGVLLPPSEPNLFRAIPSAAMETSRTLGLCLNQYAADHNGHYPEGKSSTEVFQQLIDGKYITDPEIFYFSYLPITGKVRPESDQLKPENVSWDVTCCIDSTAPNGLPVVFVTGYKVTYQAGTPAVPRTAPRIPLPKQTWFQYLFGPEPIRPHLAFSYTDSTPTFGKGISARVVYADENGNFPNFIPAGFDPKGKVYRQLTPDGELPP
jgi:hypothetical protein